MTVAVRPSLLRLAAEDFGLWAAALSGESPASLRLTSVRVALFAALDLTGGATAASVGCRRGVLPRQI